MATVGFKGLIHTRVSVLLCWGWCEAAGVLAVSWQVTRRSPCRVGRTSHLSWLWSTDVWALASRSVRLCYATSSSKTGTRCVSQIRPDDQASESLCV